MEIHQAHASSSSGARSSNDQIPSPGETSIAQRSTPDLVLWSDELGGVLEPAQEDRRAFSFARMQLTDTSFRNWCSHCVRARARRRSTSQTTLHRTRVPDHHGQPLLRARRTRQRAVHILGYVGHRSRHDGGNQRGGKRDLRHT